MTHMIRTTTAAAYNFAATVPRESQDLESVYRGMKELEYCPNKIREFSESFCRAGLVAVHLSSKDRWEKLRLSLELISDERPTAPPTDDYYSAGPSNKQTLLEQMSLLDLKIGENYPSGAVFGMLCVEPFISVKFFRTHEAAATVINTLLEDKYGRVVQVIINLGPADNFLKSAAMARAIAKYPRGSTIGVESRNLRRCEWDQSLVIYVDHPAKVRYPRIVPAVTCAKAAAEVKSQQPEAKLNEAIALFNAQNWFAAVQVYTECIEECMRLMEGSQFLPSDRSELVDRLEATELMWLALTGRCATWLQMKMYEKALSDANKAIEMESGIVNRELESCKPKIHFIKGSALFSLQRFEEAADALNVALRYNPEDKSVQHALGRSKLCHDLDSLLPSLEDTAIAPWDSTLIPDLQNAYQQSQHGHFDLSEYFLSDEAASPAIYASYTGPVEIQSRKGQGRGIFLKESVVAGQVLLVSEALALLSRNPKHITTYKSVLPIIGQDLEASARRDMSLDIQEELVAQMAYKMLSSKKLVPQVYSLSDGRSDESKVIPNMEMFLPDCDRRRAEEVKEWLSGDDYDVNIKILREIIAENAMISDGDSNGVAVQSWGVWSLPSFINHSCHPNSHKIKVGDFLIIYASQDMSSGTEITLPYFNVFQFVEGRRADSLTLGFVCRCNRCTFEKSLPCCFNNLQKKVTELLEITMYEEDDLSVKNPSSIFELARVAEALEQEMSLYSYTEEQKNWIRASIVDPYLACTRLSNDELRELHPSCPGTSRISRMSLLVDTFMAVDAGHSFGRKFAAHLLHDVARDYGWGSAEHLRQEVKVMKIYRTYYGITNTQILRQLIAKVRLQY